MRIRARAVAFLNDKKSTNRRRAFSALLAAIALAVTPAHADEPAVKSYQIAAQPVSAALKQFAAQSDMQIIFSESDVGQAKTSGIEGDLPPREALTTILKGTNLEFEFTADKVIVVTKAGSRGAARTSGYRRTSDLRLSQSDSSSVLADQSSPPISTQSTVSAGNEVKQPQESANKIEEIIVTAQKRSERLQDVPVPVTALSADKLVGNNQLRLQDYYSEIPGLSVAPSLQSAQILAIRGITTGFGNPTVGVVVDDVPYGASTLLGAGLVVPDIDPGDLARVEVLRGPQGTLYGASSMGGLLNFVTVEPSTDAVSGRVQAGISSVHNGAEPGYNLRGSVNVPLSDTFAIRASAFTRRDPGYIDNPVLNIRGINEAKSNGGRLSALWRPSELFSVKVSALVQQIEGNGADDFNKAVNGYTGPPLGDLQQNYIRGIGGYDRRVQAYSAILKARLGSAELTAITGYNINSFSDSFDFSSVVGALAQSGVPGVVDGFGVAGAAAFDRFKANKFTQEVRVSLPVTQKIEWLLGAYYTHERSSVFQDLDAADPTTGTTVGTLISFDQPITFSEAAAFTDWTFHITDRFDIQLGGRESHITEDFKETDSGPFVPVFDGAPSPRIFPPGHTSNNAFTYLVTPRLKVAPDLMVYARLASGYRAGGPNQAPGGSIPPQYDPDKTQNYEIGVKGDFLQHTLSLDTSLYYIDWKSIQLQEVQPQTGVGYNVNGSRAKSQGVEISAESKPLTGLSLSAWVAWDDAQLTQDLPPNSTVYGVPGDRLPFSARFSGNFSAEQDFPLWTGSTGFVGASVSYVGDRKGAFTASPPAPPPRQDYGAYAKTDVRIGAKTDDWTINVFVNNVTDRRGAVQGGLGYTLPFAFLYIQPRTAGVNVIRSF